MDNIKERRIIIVGRNGSGKSTLGNLLLGKCVFYETKLKECKQKTDINKKHGICLKITDTPGMFDAELPLTKSALEIQKSLELCPNPHAFLILVTPNRNSNFEKNEYIAMTVDMLRLIFGVNIFENAIVIFTHGSESEKKSWLLDNLLVSLCGERVVEAKTLEECIDPSTVNEILRQITIITCNGEASYSQPSIEIHRSFLKKYTHVGNNDIREEFWELKRKFEEDEIDVIKVENAVKLILIGKTGNGKSSTGNTLLGYDGFSVQKSLNAVTENCNMKTGFLEKQEIEVVDTPGLFDKGSSLAERALEIQKAVNICPRPNVFFLVFSSASRFTEEENFIVDIMRVIFGEKIFEHVSIVFTRGSEFNNEANFKQFWEENDAFKDLVHRCKGRIFKIENLQNQENASREEKISNKHHNKSFLDFVCALKDESPYQYDHIDVHRATLEEYSTKPTSNPQEIGQQVQDMVKNIGEKLGQNIWNPTLVAGVALLIIASASGLAAPLVGIEAPNVVRTMPLGAVVGGIFFGFVKRFWPRR